MGNCLGARENLVVPLMGSRLRRSGSPPAFSGAKGWRIGMSAPVASSFRYPRRPLLGMLGAVAGAADAGRETAAERVGLLWCTLMAVK
jgi:hypothetical protein